MQRYSPDPLHICRRELSRLRDHLERIVEASRNPECFSCAEVRRLAREGLKPPPPALDDWTT